MDVPPEASVTKPGEAATPETVAKAQPATGVLAKGPPAEMLEHAVVKGGIDQSDRARPWGDWISPQNSKGGDRSKSKTVEPTPTFEELTHEPFLAYRSGWEYVAKRFHASESFLRTELKWE